MFRLSCEHVVGVLRTHTRSLAALFSAFAFDPLVDWWLDAVEAREKQKEHVEREGGEEAEATEGTDETQAESAADDLQLESAGEEAEGAVPTAAPVGDAERSEPVRTAATAVLNEEALSIWRRLLHKLEGRDQQPAKESSMQTLDVESQVIFNTVLVLQVLIRKLNYRSTNTFSTKTFNTYILVFICIVTMTLCDVQMQKP